MGMQEVADEIIGEAEKKAAEIIKGGSEEAEKILDEAAKKTAEKKKEMKKNSEEFLSGLRTRELTKARMKIKNDTAEMKSRAVDSVYEKFFSELDSKSLLKMLSDFAHDTKAVCVSEKDYDAARKIFSVPVKKCSIEGGIIIEGDKEAIDMSIPIIKEIVKSGTIKDVSKTLFGGSHDEKA